MAPTDEIKDFFKKLFDGRVGRRDFVKLCALLLILETYENKGKIVNSIWSKLKPANDYDLSGIVELFGDLKNDFKFTLGTSHYLYKGQIHPADKAAAITLGNVSTPGLKSIETIGEQFQPNEFNGNYICIGSPTTNLLARYILQYKPDQSHISLLRTQEPVLDLEYEYVFDKNFMKEHGIIDHYMDCHGKLIPNWSLRNIKTNEIFIPKIDDNNKLLTDYLLITVIPNLLTEQALESGKKIIIFAGAHAVGTNSLDLVFKNKKILKSISKQVAGISCWQALIEVDRVYYDEISEKRPLPFSVSEKVTVAPVSINSTKLKSMMG